MQKTILLATIILLFPAAMAAPETLIQVRDMSPQPAEPGDTVKMNILVKNKGDTSAIYEPLKFDTVEGVRYIGTTSNFQNEFELCSGCQTVGNAYFKIDEDTASGIYPLDINAVSGGSGAVRKTEITVDGRPDLMVAGDIRVEQDGSNSTVLTFRNTGTDVASGTTARLSGKELSFDPSTLILGEVKVGETVNRTVRIRASEDSPAGPSDTQVVFEYSDDSTQRSSASSVPLLVESNAEITLSALEIGDAVRGEKTRVMAELENTGPGEAEDIRTRLSCGNARVARAKNFVGSLSTDESVPTVYHVVPEAGKVDCTLKASYRDSGEETMTNSFSISASRDTNWLTLTGIMAVIGLSGAYFWRRRDDG